MESSNKVMRVLKVDNIISLWRVVIPNMVSESCHKRNNVNRILKYRIKNCESQRSSQKCLKCRTWYFVRGEDCVELLRVSLNLREIILKFKEKIKYRDSDKINFLFNNNNNNNCLKK